MRKELVIHIGEDSSLTIFQTSIGIKSDMSNCKTINDIKGTFLNELVKYTEGSYEPSGVVKSITHYDIMNVSGKWEYEKKIHIINESNRGCMMAFAEKFVMPNMGRIIIVDEGYQNVENLELYCQPKQYRRFEIQCTNTDYNKRLEYIIMRVK